MRFVLALDDLLAKAVSKKLEGRVEIFRHPQMREHGDDIVRDAVMREPSVLVIGGATWNPLYLLERWRMPYEVPVVVVLPDLEWDRADRAAKINAFSVLSMKELKRKLPTSIVAECDIATAWLDGRLSRPSLPVVVQPSPEQQEPVARSASARILRPAFPE